MFTLTDGGAEWMSSVAMRKFDVDNSIWVRGGGGGILRFHHQANLLRPLDKTHCTSKKEESEKKNFVQRKKPEQKKTSRAKPRISLEMVHKAMSEGLPNLE